MRCLQNRWASSHFRGVVRYPDKKMNRATEKFRNGLRATPKADDGKQWMSTTAEIAIPRSDWM